MKFILLSAVLLLSACNGGREEPSAGAMPPVGDESAPSEAEQLFQHFNQFADDAS